MGQRPREGHDDSKPYMATAFLAKGRPAASVEGRGWMAAAPLVTLPMEHCEPMPETGSSSTICGERAQVHGVTTVASQRRSVSPALRRSGKLPAAHHKRELLRAQTASAAVDAR